jgi:hypothetical protein
MNRRAFFSFAAIAPIGISAGIAAAPLARARDAALLPATIKYGHNSISAFVTFEQAQRLMGLEPIGAPPWDPVFIDAGDRESIA